MSESTIYTQIHSERISPPYPHLIFCSSPTVNPLSSYNSPHPYGCFGSFKHQETIPWPTSSSLLSRPPPMC